MEKRDRVKFICVTSFSTMHGYINHIENVIYPAIRELEALVYDQHQEIDSLKQEVEKLKGHIELYKNRGRHPDHKS